MDPGGFIGVAVGRRKEMPMRIASGAVIAASAAIFCGPTLPAIWFAAVFAYQFIDVWVAAPIWRNPEREPTRDQRLALAASLVVSAVLYSSISMVLWFMGGVAGKAYAVLMPAGAVLAMSMQIGRSRKLLISGWAPHALYLLGVPLMGAAVSPEPDWLQMSFLSLGGLAFLLHVFIAVGRMEKGAAEIRAARDLAEAERRRAQQANAAKSDFLATISHEIRTPMNAVTAAAGLLRRTELDTVQAEHVEMLENATQVLMGLLNDVLDLSKIESGKLVPAYADFDLVQKLQLGVQLWRPQAEAKGVSIVFEPDGLPRRIVTDPLRLQQILFNLLSNAVKFTDRGAITIRGGRSGIGDSEILWLEVQDTGCGMDSETAERVFESFEQASARTARRHGGTGLGLAIARRLAELLGGGLTVRSVEGQGSVFRLEARLVEAAPEAEDAPELTAAATPDLEGAQVLLVEDHPVNQRIVKLMLEPLGLVITTCADGAEAVETAAGGTYDVILMDMQMPVMDGLEATRRIRAGAGPNCDTPIIALTANALEEHRLQWQAVGVELFVPKPIDIQGLLGTLGRALAMQPATRLANVA